MTIPGIENPPTKNKQLLEWVEEMAGLAKPDRVEWCDGSEDEWHRLTKLMVASGTMIQLNPKIRPNSFLARSSPIDVARVEDRTFICSQREIDAGPTNNWSEPSEMRAKLQGQGRVWEWTASVFAPYPGFAADPYAEYSAPWFDGNFRVLRGGSVVAAPRNLWRTGRNFYLPARGDMYCGFRTCAT